MLTFSKDNFYVFLISFFALGFLTIGVIYPEEKNSFFGIPWTWFFAWFALCLIISFRFYDEQSLRLIFSFFFILLIFILYNYLGLVLGYFEYLSFEHIVSNFSTLFITSSLCFLLFTKIKFNQVPIILDAFALSMCLGLLVFRLTIFDFSREASFLGLGPLTFIKYVSIGLISRLFFLKSWNFLSIFLYSFAFIIASSNGPLLSIAIVFITKLILSRQINLKISFPFLVILAVIFFGSERINTFYLDLGNILNSSELIIVSNSEIAFESVSSSIIRIYSYTQSINIIFENLIFGVGAGQWANAVNLQTLEYPHNSILEIWAEFGFLPALIFFAIIFKMLLSIFRGNIFAYFAYFAFLTSLTSGTIADLRFFAFYSLLMFYYLSGSSNAKEQNI